MTLVAHLCETGAVSAAHLMELTGRSHESVYAELVREYDAGRVEILIDGQHRRTWVAVVPDHELPAPLRGGALEVF